MKEERCEGYLMKGRFAPNKRYFVLEGSHIMYSDKPKKSIKKLYSLDLADVKFADGKLAIVILGMDDVDPKKELYLTADTREDYLRWVSAFRRKQKYSIPTSATPGSARENQTPNSGREQHGVVSPAEQYHQTVAPVMPAPAPAPAPVVPAPTRVAKPVISTNPKVQQANTLQDTIDAAEAGSVQHQLKLGRMYANGENGVAQDLTAASKWFVMAADTGNVDALFAAGELYKNGHGVCQDYVTAMRMFQKAASRGHCEAEYELGFFYQSGFGVRQDLDEALKWFTLAANHDFADAQYHLGTLYHDGENMPQDLTKAVQWYLRAAEQGHKEAQLTLGVLHREGHTGSSVGNPAQMERWYRAAVSAGYTNGAFSARSAYAHSTDDPHGGGDMPWGDEEEEDFVEEEEDDMYADPEEDFRWQRAQADSGHADAQFQMGVAYMKGEGAPQDYAEAMRWFKLAANQRHSDAQFNVGVMYSEGYGVPRDMGEAVRWYQKAADQGHAQAIMSSISAMPSLDSIVGSPAMSRQASSRMNQSHSPNVANEGAPLSDRQRSLDAKSPKTSARQEPVRFSEPTVEPPPTFTRKPATERAPAVPEPQYLDAAPTFTRKPHTRSESPYQEGRRSPLAEDIRSPVIERRSPHPHTSSPHEERHTTREPVRSREQSPQEPDLAPTFTRKAHPKDEVHSVTSSYQSTYGHDGSWEARRTELPPKAPPPLSRNSSRDGGTPMDGSITKGSVDSHARGSVHSVNSSGSIPSPVTSPKGSFGAASSITAASGAASPVANFSMEGKKFQKGRLIGRGTSGSVFVCLLEDGSSVAVKEIPVNEEDTAGAEAIKKEMDLMNKIAHPFVVKYYGAQVNREKQVISVFMELVTGGSLGSLVRSLDDPLSEGAAQSYIGQALLGLAHCHSQGVVHRDLKGDNLLLATDGTVKLADFGSCKTLLATDQTRGASTIAGTPVFMAPEVTDEGEKGYGFKADVWSLGITTAEICSKGAIPWPHFDSMWQALTFINDPKNKVTLPDHLSADCKDFIFKCTERDPAKRPSSVNLLSHPWISTAVRSAQQRVNPNLNSPSSPSGSRYKDPEGSLGHMRPRGLSSKTAEERQRLVKENRPSYRLGKVIGSGAFGTVYLALIEGTAEQVAAKKLTFSQNDPQLEKKLVSLQKEIKVMKSFHHPHLVTYYFSDRPAVEAGKDACLLIFMEYIAGGTLANTITSYGKLGDKMAATVAAQLLLGLGYLHFHNIVHRDVKPANCLMTTKGELKLSDFGTVREMNSEEILQTMQMSMQGTPLFMAPEVLRSSGEWGVASDIWSFGCTVLEVLTGEHPWEHLGHSRNAMKTMTMIASDKELPLPETISPLARDFLSKCLVKDPRKRLPCRVLLQHEWIRQFDIVSDDEEI